MCMGMGADVDRSGYADVFDWRRSAPPTPTQQTKQFMEPVVSTDLPVHLLALSLTLWIWGVSLARAHTFTLFSLCVGGGIVCMHAAFCFGVGREECECVCKEPIR